MAQKGQNMWEWGRIVRNGSQGSEWLRFDQKAQNLWEWVRMAQKGQNSSDSFRRRRIGGNGSE